ncbi:uncharacterized protein ZBAI_00482 [Zygosaccharomyces bailii ISA1307]|nr:uncharacterized protein ZBAI_00482 [Zygosaccharomyces bailii ISA1307]
MRLGLQSQWGRGESPVLPHPGCGSSLPPTQAKQRRARHLTTARRPVANMPHSKQAMQHPPLLLEETNTPRNLACGIWASHSAICGNTCQHFIGPRFSCKKQNGLCGRRLGQSWVLVPLPAGSSMPNPYTARAATTAT